VKQFWTKAGELLQTELFRIADTPVSGSTVLTLLVILAVTFWLAKLFRRLAERVLSKGDRGAAATVGGLVHYATLIIGFAIALSTAGINLNGLFAAGAVFAVGLGFAMKNIVENFVAGIILLTERTIKPGDIIGVDDMMVRVVNMGIRASIVRSRDGEDVIIPNSLLSQSSVKNYTLRDSQYRVRASVGVVYGADMVQVRSTLESVAKAMVARWGTESHPPLIAMSEFGNNSVNWEVGVWTKMPWDVRTLSSDLHEAIWVALKEQDIVIAFPQLDLHLDGPVVDSLRAMAKQAA